MKRSLSIVLSAAVATVLSASTLAAASAAGASGRRAHRSLEDVLAATQAEPDLVAASASPTAPGIASETTAAGVTVAVPRDPARSILVTSPDGSRIEIGIAHSNSSADARSWPGGASYDGGRTGTISVVQALRNGGVRQLFIVATAAATREFRVPVSARDGLKLRLNADGSITATDAADRTLGSFQSPWAVDSRGNAVATRYRIEGSTVFQAIYPSAAAAYPIIADPCWGCWLSKAWKYTKCAAVLGTYLFAAMRLISVLKKGASYYEFAKLLVGGSFKREKLLAIAGGVLGIDQIIGACL